MCVLQLGYHSSLICTDFPVVFSLRFQHLTLSYPSQTHDRDALVGNDKEASN